jgi:hypothetical protein
MFKDDTYLEAVMARYKLGLDHLEARQFERPLSFRSGWRDRFLFSLGKMLIVLGSRLQQRHASTTPAPYRPAYPAG